MRPVQRIVRRRFIACLCKCMMHGPIFGYPLGGAMVLATSLQQAELATIRRPMVGDPTQQLL